MTSAASVRAFEADDLLAAAALLAERHRAHRLSCPLLSPRYEDASVAADQVAAAFALPGASGAVALAGEVVVGFVLGAPKDGSGWGQNIWIDAAGHAAADAEVLRDMYALAAARWADESRTAHYVLVPAGDDQLLRGWYRLGFGQQQAHAVRAFSAAETAGTSAAPAGPAGLMVRPAERGDLPTLARLEVELPRHQRLAPVFSAAPVPSYEECLAGWEEDFGDPAYSTFVAELEGEVVGSSIGCSLELSGGHAPLSRPDRAGFLGFAAVLPRARGHGVGRALGEAVIAWSAQAGYSCVASDWRVTNLLSSRTWPRLGFAETFLRLHRLIGY
jgi:GNAT superfamily N-acetyltransferase